MEFIWLASWPRSGNTYLRAILYRCFGIESCSMYPNDLGGNTALENLVGHVERSVGPYGEVSLCFRYPDPNPDIIAVKTHDIREADLGVPAIYILRNGYDACVSMAAFYRCPIRHAIPGCDRFGTWGDHLSAWEPENRPDTLLLRYEHMVEDPRGAIDAISGFLNRSVICPDPPSREEMHAADPRFVRKPVKTTINAEDEKLFWRLNGDMMKKYGYAPVAV